MPCLAGLCEAVRSQPCAPRLESRLLSVHGPISAAWCSGLARVRAAPEAELSSAPDSGHSTGRSKGRACAKTPREQRGSAMLGIAAADSSCWPQPPPTLRARRATFAPTVLAAAARPVCSMLVAFRSRRALSTLRMTGRPGPPPRRSVGPPPRQHTSPCLDGFDGRCRGLDRLEPDASAALAKLDRDRAVRVQKLAPRKLARTLLAVGQDQRERRRGRSLACDEAGESPH